MKKINWDEKLSVDIPEIDELQKKMLALINVLIDLKESSAEGKELTNMISEINEYSKYYFSIEEEYLKKNKYPEFLEHWFSGPTRSISLKLSHVIEDMFLHRN